MINIISGVVSIKLENLKTAYFNLVGQEHGAEYRFIATIEGESPSQELINFINGVKNNNDIIVKKDQENNELPYVSQGKIYYSEDVVNNIIRLEVSGSYTIE